MEREIEGIVVNASAYRARVGQSIVDKYLAQEGSVASNPTKPYPI